MTINPELFQEFCPEALELEILEVATTRVPAGETVRLGARVRAVIRTAAGLAPGDGIEIRYLRDDESLARAGAWIDRARAEGFTGEVPDHPPHPPAVGATTRAYLAPCPGAGAGFFRPDAHHHSFE